MSCAFLFSVLQSFLSGYSLPRSLHTKLKKKIRIIQVHCTKTNMFFKELNQHGKISPSCSEGNLPCVVKEKDSSSPSDAMVAGKVFPRRKKNDS